MVGIHILLNQQKRLRILERPRQFTKEQDVVKTERHCDYLQVHLREDKTIQQVMPIYVVHCCLNRE